MQPFSMAMWRRIIALSMAVAMLFTGAPVYAAQTGAQLGQLAVNNTLRLAPGEITSATQETSAAQVGADVSESTATSEGEQSPSVDLMAGRTVKVQVDEATGDDPINLTPDFGDAGTYYDENAASAANDHMEYLGSVEGTDLATYEIKRDESMAVSEFDSIMDDSQIAVLKAYYEADYPRGEELQELIAQADTHAGEVREKLDSGNLMTSLVMDKQNPHFKVIQVDQTTGDATQVQSVTSVAAMNYMDSNYEGELTALAANGSSAGPSGGIYVVDDDSILIFVQDENGQPLNGAAVTIKTTGGKVLNGVTQTQNGAGGSVTFTGLSGITSGFLNIEAHNVGPNRNKDYRIITELDIDMAGGTHIIRQLTPTNRDDVYVRCMSAGGAEMMNKSAKLWLTTMDTKPFDVTVLLASGGGAGALNGRSLSLMANGTRVLRTVEGRSYDSYTKAFTFSEKWAQKNGLLKDGDILTIKDNRGNVYQGQKVNLTIKDSPVEKPEYGDISISLLGKGTGSFELPKDVPFIGESKFDMDVLDFKFSVIYTLSGKGVFSYNAQINKFIDYKEFWEEPWEPRKQEKTDKSTKVAQDEFNQKMDLYTSARAFLKPKDGKPTKFLDASKSVDLNAIFCGQIEYDWDTSYINIDLNAMVVLSGQFGLTYYVAIPAPIPPIYVGFNLTASAGVGGYVGVRFKSEDILNTFGISPDGKNGINIALGVGLALYVGAGIHGLMCVEADGHVGLDANIDFRANNAKPPDKSYPRFTLDFQYGATLRAVMLVFSFSKSWNADPKRLVDTWGLDKSETFNATETTEIYEITFSGEGGAEGVASEYGSASGMLATAPLTTMSGAAELSFANGEDASDGMVSAVNSSVSTELPFKLLNVNGTNYLFRIAYMRYGENQTLHPPYPTLVYQKQLPSGAFEDKLYLVPHYDYDEWYCNDYEFDVTTLDRKGRPNEVLIVVTTGRLREGKPEARARQTITRVLHMDMPNNKLVAQVLASEWRETPYRYQPKIGWDSINKNYSIMWLESPNLDDVGKKSNTTIQTAHYMPDTHEVPYHFGNKPGKPVTGIYPFPFEVEEALFINIAVLQDGNGSRISSTNGKISIPYSEPVSNLQPLFQDPILPSPDDVILFNVGGKLQFFSKKIANRRLLKTVDGKEFILPENCVTYQYFQLGDGNKNGNAVSKLAIVTKETIVPKLDGEPPRVDTFVTVYNILRDEKGDIIARGPIIYTLTGQDVNRVDLQCNQGYLHMVYTSNKTSTVVQESTSLTSGAINPGIVAEACEMYQWDERSATGSVEATELSVKNPFINKKDSVIQAKVTVQNNTSRYIKNATFQIVDYNGNLLGTFSNKIGELYPGESQTVEVEFSTHSSWQVGAMSITAKVTSAFATGAESAAVNDTGITLICDDFAIGLDAQEVILDSGYYASVNFYNESMMPTTASETYLRAYTLAENKLPTQSAYAFSYKVGELLEGEEENGEFAAHSYNTLIPLDQYWQDETCSGIVFELSAMDGDELVTKTVKLDNPNAAHRFVVSGVANDATYGNVSGGGYLLPGDSTTLEAIPYDGYRFVRWVDENGSEVSRDASYSVAMVENTATRLTAQFEETGELHRVTLVSSTHVAGASSSGAPDLMEDGLVMALDAQPVGSPSVLCYRVAHGNKITVSATPDEGFRFVRWEDEDGKQLSTTADYTFTVSREISVKAVFAYEGECFTVFFDAAANGGRCTVASMLTDADGKLASLPTATKSGATFQGWYTSATGGTRVTVDTAFTQDTLVYAQFSSSGKPSGGDSKSDQTYGAGSIPIIAGISPAELGDQARKALGDGGTYVCLSNVQALTPKAMKAAADAAKAAGKELSIYADTIKDGVVVLRLYIDPVKGAALSSEIQLLGSIGDAGIQKLFEKHFSNKIRIIAFDQQKSFGMPVGVAAKVDLEGLNTKNLYFYSYDKATNSYERITTRHWIDTNGYLRFTTTLAGHIIITDGPLAPR